MKNNYLVATVKSWNIKNFYKLKKEDKKNNWYIITDKKDLNYEKINKINPEYIFFPHWSWIIPEEIYNNFKCIVFHMTDLPFGRGGSPLQNLISRGIYKTKVCAIKVVKELDAGDIYLKKNLNLKDGSAKEIFKKASDITFSMIKETIEKNPILKKQEGKVVKFKRRTPDESRIPEERDLRKIYDWIRMLDAEGYPPAFIETKELTLEFNKAKFKEGYVKANVKIKKRADKDEK
ncbi:methionyl-tRNA formyltransferase [Euryarchaeota archaeon SM23-78]|nr:MAG: methionyl-tRNA formyltransferase [Euryarchaeota archaeon SM23-78]MBW3000350.1 methionyl-tRNA formyltransferase [Candidatus Woesearchaeota archaeon]